MAKIIDKEAKRLEILHAALRAFAQKGTADTKIQDIAQEAGIAQGTIYLYFKNKEEIFEEIVKTHVAGMDAITRHFEVDSADPWGQLQRLILEMTSRMSQDHTVLLLDIWAAMIRNPRFDWAGKGYHGFQDLVANCLSQGDATMDSSVNTHHLASAIIALIHGLSLLQLVDKERFPQQEILKQTLEIIFKGITAS